MARYLAASGESAASWVTIGVDVGRGVSDAYALCGVSSNMAGLLWREPLRCGSFAQSGTPGAPRDGGPHFRRGIPACGETGKAEARHPAGAARFRGATQGGPRERAVTKRLGPR